MKTLILIAALACPAVSLAQTDGPAPRTADGKLAMTTESLDVHRLLSEAPPGIELDSGPRDL